MPATATRAQTSTQEMMKNQARYRRATDGMWKIAKKAPQFTCVKAAESGREYNQYTRLINTNAYKIAMSGACAAVSGELEIDMKHLGMDYTPDSKTRPWSATLSPGAAFMLEQFLATVVQQIVYHNLSIRKGIKRHARNHKEVTKLAVDEVRRSIFTAASGVPDVVSALPMSVARKAKKGEGESAGEKEFDNTAGAEAAAEEEGGEEGEEGDAEE